MSKISNRQLEAFTRFVSSLPSTNEIDLVILKAHLLIDNQINLIIEKRLQNSKALFDAANIESFEKICLAEAFFPSGFRPWLWSALKKLNKLRNDIGSRLSPTGIDVSIDQIIRGVPTVGDLASVAETRQARFEIS